MEYNFGIPKTLAWDEKTNRRSNVAKRQADVFALLAHTEQQTLDPLDVSQWSFFVLPTTILNHQKLSQQSITLPSLKRLTDAVEFAGLSQAIEKAAR